MKQARKNSMELVVMGANPTRKRVVRNPIDNFTPREKMHLGMLGISWKNIQTPADVARAKESLKAFYKVRHNTSLSRHNPGSDIVDGAEPEEEVLEIYEGFHDASADGKYFKSVEPHIPSGDYPFLGTLFALKIKPMPGRSYIVQTFMPKGRPGVIVTCSKDRRKLYLAQGNQKMSERNLAQYNADDSNICELGEVREISYMAVKNHSQLDDAARGELLRYDHKFESPLPKAFYNRSMCRVILQGGGFTVRDVGIDG
jgi:hypothetical protein